MQGNPGVGMITGDRHSDELAASFDVQLHNTLYFTCDPLPRGARPHGTEPGAEHQKIKLPRDHIKPTVPLVLSEEHKLEL
jgi:hypothetical protein